MGRPARAGAGGVREQQLDARRPVDPPPARGGADRPRAVPAVGSGRRRHRRLVPGRRDPGQPRRLEAGGRRLAGGGRDRRRLAPLRGGAGRAAASARYAYRVRGGAGGPMPDAAGRTEFSFRTPRPDAVKLAFMGDTGSGEPRQYDVAARLATEDPPPDGITIVGDLIYPHGEDAGYDPQFFAPYRSLLSAIPFYAALGQPRLRDLVRRPAPRRLHAAPQLPLDPGARECVLGRARGRPDDRAQHEPPRRDPARRRPAVARDDRPALRRLPPRRAAPPSLLLGTQREGPAHPDDQGTLPPGALGLGDGPRALRPRALLRAHAADRRRRVRHHRQRRHEPVRARVGERLHRGLRQHRLRLHRGRGPGAAAHAAAHGDRRAEVDSLVLSKPLAAADPVEVLAARAPGEAPRVRASFPGRAALARRDGHPAPARRGHGRRRA